MSRRTVCSQRPNTNWNSRDQTMGEKPGGLIFLNTNRSNRGKSVASSRRGFLDLKPLLQLAVNTPNAFIIPAKRLRCSSPEIPQVIKLFKSDPFPDRPSDRDSNAGLSVFLHQPQSAPVHRPLLEENVPGDYCATMTINDQGLLEPRNYSFYDETDVAFSAYFLRKCRTRQGRPR